MEGQNCVSSECGSRKAFETILQQKVEMKSRMIFNLDHRKVVLGCEAMGARIGSINTKHRYDRYVSDKPTEWTRNRNDHNTTISIMKRKFYCISFKFIQR